MRREMRIWCVAVIGSLLGLGSICAQSPGLPDQSLSLAQDPSTGIFTMSWWAQAGNTYFIQQSSDLVNWTFLPMMDSTTTNAPLGYQFTSSVTASFWRLRYVDQTYDAWAETVGYDPEQPPFPPDPTSAAPGNPALTILQCFQNGYKPFSYYAGREPALTIISGNNQYGAPGQALPEPLVVEVRDAVTNDLLINAPVNYFVRGGDPNGNNGNISGNLVTGPDGRLCLTFVTSPDTAAVSQITIQGGTNNQVGVVFTEGNEPPPDPPTGVNVVQNVDGTIDMTWQYPQNNTVSFQIQIRGNLGQWVTLGVAPPNTSSVHIDPVSQTFTAQ